MSVRRVSAIALPLAVLALGCDSGPKRGELAFDLVTPNSNTGAVVVSVTAAAPLAVEVVEAVCAGCRVYTVSVTDQELRTVVLGDLMSGPFIRVTVSDVKVPEGYQTAVRQVAGREFALLSVAGYRLDPAR